MGKFVLRKAPTWDETAKFKTGGREGGRDLDESEKMHLGTCEHLPARILRVSEQPETWSKG